VYPSLCRTKAEGIRGAVEIHSILGTSSWLGVFHCCFGSVLGLNRIKVDGLQVDIGVIPRGEDRIDWAVCRGRRESLERRRREKKGRDVRSVDWKVLNRCRKVVNFVGVDHAFVRRSVTIFSVVDRFDFGMKFREKQVNWIRYRV
jgi:hypothetical protein